MHPLINRWGIEYVEIFNINSVQPGFNISASSYYLTLWCLIMVFPLIVPVQPQFTYQTLGFKQPHLSQRTFSMCNVPQNGVPNNKTNLTLNLCQSQRNLRVLKLLDLLLRVWTAGYKTISPCEARDKHLITVDTWEILLSRPKAVFPLLTIQSQNLQN